jgi:predicted glycosyl hydrolase (DUF1957 family)
MKYLNLFFHIYQPPVQNLQTLNQIVRESYEPLTRLIREFSDLKFTLNINYSLVELLNQAFPDIIGNITKGYENGNLELTATGAYHPIFPLIPEKEIRRQLEINDTGNRELLSSSFSPEGVFPPEMAFDGSLVSLFKSIGYKWTIVDDKNVSYYGIEIPYNKVYSVEGFAVFLRSNLWANRFADYREQWENGQDCMEELVFSLNDWMRDNDGYIIIALDGETFGHHHPDLGEKFLTEFFQAFRDNNKGVQFAHLSEIYRLFPHIPQFIPPGSWSTDEENLRSRDYFSWWKSDKSKIHELQWEFTDYVLDKVRALETNKEINDEMDKALFSCQYWWASYWKFNPVEIYKGAFNMMRILQRVAELLDDEYEQIKEGEEIFRELVTEVEKEKDNRENNYG